MLGVGARRRQLDRDELAAPALVLAPHPDDETLGCGGIIALKRRLGAEVTIVVATDGRGSHARLVDPDRLAVQRRAEAIDAAAALGVGRDDVVFLDIHDGELDVAAAGAATDLARLLDERRPAQLFAPSRWEPVADHAAASDLARLAAAAADHRVTIMEYPVWLWHGWPHAPLDRPLRPRALLSAVRSSWRVAHRFPVRVALGDALEAKRRALAAHRSQTERQEGRADWPVLADVGGGELLARLLTGEERFMVAPEARP